jgi:superfamily I DNA/RNA helicase
MEAKAKFTEEQLSFIKHKSTDSIILSATAGSGKTASATGRLIWLLNNGVRPEKIIYFSFTNDAVDELRTRIKNDKIEITTIHSFCARVLGKSKKFKPLVETAMFPNWFRKKYAPKKKSNYEEKIRFDRYCRKLEEDPNKIFSDISKYKLIMAEGTKDKLPPFFIQYQQFLRETRTRDFADMLTDTLKLTESKTWENNWEYMYQYVFVDEYQDTSALQMKILLALRAKTYHLIGDRNQSIYGFQGSDCDKIEKLLKEKKIVKEYNLSTNFRSAKDIVENANLYSDLIAKPHSKKNGLINRKLLTEQELLKMMRKQDVVLLARTNKVIKGLELKFLSKKIPLKYFNILDNEDLEIIEKKAPLNVKQKRKFKTILSHFDGTADELVEFIRGNMDSKSFVTSIHKSKGREYPTCVIVNSLSPEILEFNNIELDEKELKRFSFDPESYEDRESKNIHYVAVTRPKDELFYMMVDEETFSII